MEKTEYRAVTKFLHLKRKNTQEIKDELDSVYGEASPSFTTVKHWVAEYKRGRTSILDEERSERPKPLQKFNTGNVSTGIVQSQLLVPLRERQNIWRGIVELCEKVKNPRRFVPCQISANAKGGDPELKADTWPPKLIMQLIPKKLIGRAGVTYLRNSKCVVFHPTPCEALESLTKMMTAGFAGCVHFTFGGSSPACKIKLLILLYVTDKKTYLGFIPNDQTVFIDRLRTAIQREKTSQNASVRQANPGPGNTIPAPMPATGTQGGILMSQTNTMAMGGGQITQNVVSTALPQTLTSTSGPQTQMNMQNIGISDPQANAGAGGMIGQQRPQFDDLEIARHQNLLKIQHLRQTLEAAQQREAQYKSQLEVRMCCNCSQANNSHEQKRTSSELALMSMKSTQYIWYTSINICVIPLPALNG